MEPSFLDRGRLSIRMYDIVCDQATGDVFYGPDGTGAAAQIKFVVVANHLQLSAASFQIV